jgi:hypothetical protein
VRQSHAGKRRCQGRPRLARIAPATIRFPRLGTYKRNHEKQIEQEEDVGRDEADMKPHLAGTREGWRPTGGSGGATALGIGEGNEEQVRVGDERVREMGLVGVDSTGLGPSGPIHLIWSGWTNWAQPN